MSDKQYVKKEKNTYWLVSKKKIIKNNKKLKN